MKEGIGGSPLKPDILGCHGLPPPPTHKVSWGNVEIVIEVKNAWPALIAQGATYAHAVFASWSSRWFVLVIAFNHKDSCVRFCLYHRSGLYSTEALNLTNRVDFLAFVSTLVGVLSWPNRYAAGMDKSHNNLSICIPSFGIYDIVKTFCDRQVVRGRAMRVYFMKRPSQAKIVGERGEGSIWTATGKSAEGVRDMDDEHKSEVVKNKERSSFKFPQQFSHYHLRDRSGTGCPHAARLPTIWGEKKPKQSQPTSHTNVVGTRTMTVMEEYVQCALLANAIGEEDISDNRNIFNNKLALDSFVLKDSWPLAGRDSEAEMFKDVKGEFGVPVLLGSYCVDKVHTMTLPDAKAWDVFCLDRAEEKPELC